MKNSSTLCISKNPMIPVSFDLSIEEAAVLREAAADAGVTVDELMRRETARLVQAVRGGGTPTSRVVTVNPNSLRGFPFFQSFTRAIAKVFSNFFTKPVAQQRG